MSEVKLVPAQMLLDKDVIGAINFHCGDGNTCGEYCDGILWVGTVTDDEGQAVYGLHLSTAEYPEEGSTTLVEFSEPADAQRLRADTAEAELSEMKLSRDYCNRVALHNKELGEELERKIATAEQRISELEVLLMNTAEVLRSGNGYGWEEAQADIIDAALNPNPEGHYSDCATNNRGVPELLGPCDCGYEGKQK